MADCGRKETCGGFFSSGPGDSDWQICDTHSKDIEHFGAVYTAQCLAPVDEFPMPKTVNECRAYLAKKSI